MSLPYLSIFFKFIPLLNDNGVD